MKIALSLNITATHAFLDKNQIQFAANVFLTTPLKFPGPTMCARRAHLFIAPVVEHINAALPSFIYRVILYIFKEDL